MAERPDPSLGVFETLLVRDGRIQSLAAHLARLEASLHELYAMSLPPQLASTAGARAAGLRGPHRLRIDAVPSGGGLEVTLTTSPVDPGRPRAYALAPVTVSGGHGPHKWRDRRALGQVSAAPVPLLVDEDGTVLEAAWANLWLLDGDRLTTPPADGRILPGVVRARLLAGARALGLTAVERSFTLDQARAASMLMLTSSLALAATGGLSDVPPPDATVEAIRAALERDGWEDGPPRC